LPAILKILGPIATAVVALSTVVVLLDWFGIADTLGEEAERNRTQRLPGEFLYLDQERSDAFLGQLQNGLAPTETRTAKIARKREAKIGGSETAQLGGSVEESEEAVSTISPKAADRAYVLHGRLAEDFKREAGVLSQEAVGGQEGKYAELDTDQSFDQVLDEMSALNEGDFVRIDNARLRLPTYTLALGKLAHAELFRSPGQRKRRLRVSRRDLSTFAIRRQKALEAYVTSFGEDPRLPFRLDVSRPKADSKPATPDQLSVFLPGRYSSLVDAPSLLTGRVTILGKVIRKVDGKEPTYYDAETAVTYERAVKGARRGVRRILAVPKGTGREVVQASATASPPALVVVPVVIYK